MTVREMVPDGGGMTFNQYLASVVAAQAQHPQWRYGQALFNVLAEVRPELAEVIRGSVLDPFHGQNERGFLVVVEKYW